VLPVLQIGHANVIFRAKPMLAANSGGRIGPE
jgi:hypothetical protein